MLFPKFFLISLLLAIISATHSYSQCLDDQKSFLLELKNELIFDSSISRKLIQWNETYECCSWYGVDCDAAGYVISLQLDDETILGGIGESSSLFKLKYLKKLNLAFNDFNFTQIPRGIQNLSYLTHLNLSNAAFGGEVPVELSYLSRLVSLDISSSYWDSYDDTDYQDWEEPLKLEHLKLEVLLKNLTRLKELYLDDVDISSRKSEWSHIISSNLPDLTSLSLRGCSVSGPLDRSLLQHHALTFLRLDDNNLSTEVPDFIPNLSSLITLSLKNCSLIGSLPKMMFQIPTLQNLDLSMNPILSGSLPPFSQTSASLKSIELWGNNLSGQIPTSVSNLKSLSHIILSSNKFTGPIPSTFANLTKLVLADFSFNSFTGSLPFTLFEGLSNLVHFDLRSNSFSGSIPNSLFRLPSLVSLSLGLNKFNGLDEEFPILNVSNNIWKVYLGSNRLEGPIPDSFFQLQSLRYLSLSHNLFNGTFQLEKIQSLPNLIGLDLSYNNLSVVSDNNVNSSSYYPHLSVLGLASCNLYNIPHFIKHSEKMSAMDLSNNRIAGEIPSWIWGIGSQLRALNLSSNLLTGFEKPFHIPTSLTELDLSSNQLQGELHLPFQSNGSLTSNLYLLSVANNNLSGSIPTSLCDSAFISAVDLSENKLSGNIPPCLLQNRESLEVFNLGKNNISGYIPDNFSVSCCRDC